MKASDFRDSAPMTVAFVAEGLCWGSFAAQVPVLKAQIGASDSQFGTAMLVAALGAVTAMWLAPRVERSLGAPAMAILGLGMALFFLLPGLLGSVVLFALAMMMASVFSGTLDVVMNARVSVMEASVGRSLMGYHHGVFSVAYALSAFMTGLARAGGLTSFQIFFCVAVVIGALALVMLRSAPSTPNGKGKKDPALGAVVWVVVLGGAILLIGFMAEQSTEAWSALHLERTLGAGAVGGALGPTLLGATMALGRFGGQIIVNRVGPMKVILIASAVSALGAFMAAAAPALSVAYAGFIILGFGVSVVAPMCFVIVGRAVTDETRTKAISRVTAFGYAGFFIGPPIMGYLAKWQGLDASFAFVGAALLLIPLLAWALSKRAE